MRPEYDLRKLKFIGRGIYAERYRSGTNLVLLDPDVRKAFPDDESVNEALRIIAKAAKRHSFGGKRGLMDDFQNKIDRFKAIVL